MYDLIIIGAGPAGITSALYAVRKKMKFTVITKEVGGQTNWTKNIENYTGFQLISGAQLVQNFREQLQKYNVSINENESVRSLETQLDKTIKVVTSKNEYIAKTVIIASGKIPRILGVEGENKFRNKGLAYCATCDAPMFADVDVAVIGGGNSALDAVLQLVNFAKKVYIIDKAKQLVADPIMLDKARVSKKVEVYNNSSVKKVYGDSFVKGIVIEKDSKEIDLKVEGVFVEIGYMPSNDFVHGILRNDLGEIMVNCKCETNMPGVFAAGDVTSVPAKQIIVASGEGAKATIAVFDYLNKKE